ncbi:MAG TPA: succinylglutamate desuccinylase/aspartoacylase family protein [Sphingobacteriaceae bacterium]|nr:succinylglutamate desuccinylase/aspartoacylase family protein [Sphingobacteriaceae bacterium]
MIPLAHFNGSSKAAGPGEKLHTAVPVGRLADGRRVELPVVIVRGSGEGPTVYVQAAVHGDEVNGIEVIRRFLHALEPSALSGSIIAVPVANLPAFTARQRHTPWDGADMNRAWPGKPDGNMSERMAHALFESFVRQADAVIDLHADFADTVMHALFLPDQRESRRLAEVFGLPVLIQDDPEAGAPDQRFQGQLARGCAGIGTPAITVQLGGPGRFHEEAVAAGVRGLWNVFRYLRITPGEPEPPRQPQVVVEGRLTKALAPSGGLFVPAVAVGDKVELGQPLGTIYGLQRLVDEADVPAPVTGMVVALNPHPTVHTGEVIALVGKMA